MLYSFVNSTLQEIFTNTNTQNSVDIDVEFCFHYLQEYKQAIEHTRKAFNIMGSQEIVDNHIIDSMSPLSLFIQVSQRIQSTNYTGINTAPIAIADLGTGAGLPGIPLAIAFEAAGMSSKWYLVERSHKKAHFLELFVQTLTKTFTHTDIFVIPCNLKEWNTPPHIDLLTARAFKPLDKILKDMKSVAPHSEMLLYKGKKITIEEEFSPFVGTSLTIEKTHQLFHEQEKERHIVHACWV